MYVQLLSSKLLYWSTGTVSLLASFSVMVCTYTQQGWSQSASGEHSPTWDTFTCKLGVLLLGPSKIKVVALRFLPLTCLEEMQNQPMFPRGLGFGKWHCKGKAKGNVTTPFCNCSWTNKDGWFVFSSTHVRGRNAKSTHVSLALGGWHLATLVVWYCKGDTKVNITIPFCNCSWTNKGGWFVFSSTHVRGRNAKSTNVSLALDLATCSMTLQG